LDLKDEFNLAIIFIAHDLAVVKHISDRILVMYVGRTIEIANTESLFTDPQHPYPQFLLDAIPIPTPKIKTNKRRIQGELPSPISPPTGCRFQTRCPHADTTCKTEPPELVSGDDSEHLTACHHKALAKENWSTPWDC